MTGKNILIIGCSRSGKSTLAKTMKGDTDYNHIPLDYFTSSLKHNFKETNITSNVVIDRASSKNLSLLLSRVMDIMNNSDEKFIIDSAHIYPSDIIKYVDLNKWNIICLVYPDVTPLEKLKMIRKYDCSTDWTAKRSDEELLEILEKLIEISKQMVEECRKYDIPCYNTSRMWFDNSLEF